MESGVLSGVEESFSEALTRFAARTGSTRHDDRRRTMSGVEAAGGAMASLAGRAAAGAVMAALADARALSTAAARVQLGGALEAPPTPACEVMASPPATAVSVMPEADGGAASGVMASLCARAAQLGATCTSESTRLCACRRALCPPCSCLGS